VRIIVPYTIEYQPTREALALWKVDYVEVDADRGYLDLMRSLWTAGKDFTIVEHDVVVQPGQLPRLTLCPQGWCCFTEYPGGPPTFSIVRFRSEFIAANRDVWDDIDSHVEPVASQPLWTLLDSWLVAHADREAHRHTDPPARNVRPFGSLH
jgi:hypothetical protein